MEQKEQNNNELSIKKENKTSDNDRYKNHLKVHKQLQRHLYSMLTWREFEEVKSLMDNPDKKEVIL